MDLAVLDLASVAYLTVPLEDDRLLWSLDAVADAAGYSVCAFGSVRIQQDCCCVDGSGPFFVEGAFLVFVQ